jgi:hypothetical protein
MFLGVLVDRFIEGDPDSAAIKGLDHPQGYGS